MNMLQPLAATTDSMQWAFYALIAGGIAYVVVRPWLTARKKDPLEKKPNMGLSQQKALEREMTNVVVDLSKMARQISSQLDNRATKLELLIQEADAKIAELKKLPVSIASGRADPQPPAPTPPVPQPAEPQADARYTQIYALSDEGRSPQEISQRLGRPCGEVELILALRRR